MISKRTALAAIAAIAASAPAHAAVTISADPTQNMSCSNGTCTPTATNAVLNASDLQSDLSQFGNVHVMTTGSGVEANNIVVKAAFSAPDSTSLTLEAHKAITVNAAVSIGSGSAELELQSDTLDATDALSFDRKGHITFGSLSDIFGINGGIFTLVGSVQGLASAVAANPSGAFALANEYDASQDGTYTTSPISATFNGDFEGLGNAIIKLSVTDIGDSNVGMFATLGKRGKIHSISIAHARVRGNSAANYLALGVLVGLNAGKIYNSSVSGKVSAPGPISDATGVGGLAGTSSGLIAESYADCVVTGPGGASIGGLIGWNTTGAIKNSHSAGLVGTRGSGGGLGGLVGTNYGRILTSFSTSSVAASRHAGVGGLVGFNGTGVGTSASIDRSFATGNVSSGHDSSAGGLVGDLLSGTITNSYATAAVAVGYGKYTDAGGVVGEQIGGSMADSYSIGSVSATGKNLFVGGVIGYDDAATLTNLYWDTTTSGLSQGCGNITNCATGLTTEQLQSGLPTGFDPKIWAENPNINNGLPYLINNPPPK